MSQTLHERVYHTSNGNVFYWIDASADTDAPWLVFLPGLTADHTMFDAQMAYFSGKANCLVWDAPAHGKSRPYPLDFSMDDCARILHAIMEAEEHQKTSCCGPVGRRLRCTGVHRPLSERSRRLAVSIDSAPLKRKYHPTWEVKALRHTKWMYQFVPWSWLKALGSWGVATTAQGRPACSFIESYAKEEYVELAAHGYKMLADAVESLGARLQH